MGFTKNNRLTCDHCGIFMKRIYDSYTLFGYSNPEAPEPYDPTDMCKKCSKEDEKKWLEWFKGGSRYGNWCKSKGEVRAAKKCKLRWIHSEETINGKLVCYTYVEEIS